MSSGYELLLVASPSPSPSSSNYTIDINDLRQVKIKNKANRISIEF